MSQTLVQEPDILVLLRGVTDAFSHLSKARITAGRPDVCARLDELRSLRDGWLEDGGKAPSHDGLDWLQGSFERHYPRDLPPPYAYPTPDGGISLEWTIGRLDIDIEVSLEERTGWWYVFNKDTGRGESEKTLNLDDPEAWRWAGKQLRDLMG